MDAVEYLKGKNRMCDNCAEDYGEECMLHTKAQEVGELCSTYAQRYPAEAVEIVERWVKEHPAKTRQSEVLKMFPSASKQGDGILTFCPRAVDTEFLCPRKHSDDYSECVDCRRDFWLAGGGRMRILRSKPFILLYISITILGIGCVLLGSRGMFEPFNVFPLAVTLIAVGGIMTAAFGTAAWIYVMEMVESGKIDDDE